MAENLRWALRLTRLYFKAGGFEEFYLIKEIYSPLIKRDKVVETNLFKLTLKLKSKPYHQIYSNRYKLS